MQDSLAPPDAASARDHAPAGNKTPPAMLAGIVLGVLLGLPALLDLPSTGWTGHHGEPRGLPIEPLAIDVNLASEERLSVLPGVGPVLARRLVEERERMPFADADDLLRTHGVGSATVEQLRGYLRFGPTR
jgi:competence protein ComEA